jgi:hypothetical protein
MALPKMSEQPIDFTRYYNIVDGQFRSSKQTYHGTNPATGDAMYPAPVAEHQDVVDAVMLLSGPLNRGHKPLYQTVVIESKNGRKRALHTSLNSQTFWWPRMDAHVSSQRWRFSNSR